MGILDAGAGDATFSSRARATFTMAGETDSGLSFGASFRADNAATRLVPDGSDADTLPDRAGGANDGDAGSVFISGAFGKLTMGDVDGAAQMATGHVSGVGYTGLNDWNESTFIGAGDGDTDPTALYEYSTGAVTAFVSITDPVAGVDEIMSIGAKYATDVYSVGIGYADDGTDSDVVLSGSATFSGVTLKALYGQRDDDSQMAVSADYSIDAIGVTAYYTDDSELGGAKAYGVGATYDLGGGASLAGGVAQNKTADVTAYDVGVKFSF